MARSAFKYKSYNFIDKDPIIDRMRTLHEDSGRTFREIRDDSGVSTSTMSAWFNGRTRRPQFATVSAFILSVGARGVTFVGGKPNIVGGPVKIVRLVKKPTAKVRKTG